MSDSKLSLPCKKEVKDGEEVKKEVPEVLDDKEITEKSPLNTNTHDTPIFSSPFPVEKSQLKPN